MTEPGITVTANITEQPDSVDAHVVVEKARAAGIGDALNEDELYQALQAVYLAKASERERVVFDGPLWLSYAERGIKLASAVLDILKFFGVHPSS